jgi:hypothetical protein
MKFLMPQPKPIQAFTIMMGRFSDLSEGEIKEFQNFVSHRYEKIHNLSMIP